MRTLFLLTLVAALSGCAHPQAAPTVAPQASVPAPAKPAPDPKRAMQKAQEAYALLSTDPVASLARFEEAWDLSEHKMIAYYAGSAAALVGRPEEAVTWLHRAVEQGFEEPEAVLEDPNYKSIRGEPRVVALLQKLKAEAAARLARANPGGGLPRSTPAAEGLDEAALAALLKAAEDADSHGLVLLRNGRLVGEWYFGSHRSPIEAMSATKSVTSLAVGLLLQDGKLRSLDEPVATFFPEWNTGTRASVTVRHLLNHTSGLVADRTTEAIYASPDFVKHALQSEVTQPGEAFFYNNSAVNLLAGVVGVAAGKRMDLYLQERLFNPLGITDVTWTLDPAGNPHGMSGLQIHPADFAKLGQLMLDGGVWQGKRLLDAGWVAQSTARPSQPFNPMCGLLWWLTSSGARYSFAEDFFREMEARKVEPAMVEKLAPLRGTELTRSELLPRINELLGPEGITTFQVALAKAKVTLRQKVTRGYDGFAALGYLGQVLLVLPEQKLVAVRMTHGSEELSPEQVEFPEFSNLVRQLVPKQKPAAAAR